MKNTRRLRARHDMVHVWPFFTVAILLSLVAIVVMGPARAAETPTDAVRTTVNEAIIVLQDQGLKNPDRAAERINRLKSIADSRFDYGEMAKRALGAQWNKMSESEQKEFVDLFTKLLTAAYADKIGLYSGEQVKYLEERLEGDDYAEVRSKMIGKTTIPLDYRLLKKDGEWRAYDVVIDGVSLVKNYRGQFTSVMRSSSYDHLVQTLREKVEKYKEREGGQVPQ
jgi:phospholipid transport system substrate-binding protein